MSKVLNFKEYSSLNESNEPLPFYSNTIRAAHIPTCTGSIHSGEKKSQFDIILINAEKNRLSIMKYLRNEILNLTGNKLNLIESKQIIDHTPVTIFKGISKEECDRIKDKLISLGAEVNIK